MDKYGKLCSLVYEKTKPIGKSINGDLEFYYEEIKDIKGNILEAGVGTGRLYIPFYEKGLNIIGVDISKEMLDICKDECEKRNINPKLYEDNLIDMKLKEKFDAIIIPTGSFCLIDSKKASRTLKNLYNHLDNKGKLILDIEIPGDFNPNSINSKIFEINDFNIRMEVHNLEIDYINQINKSYIIYEKWVDSKLVDTEIQGFNLYWYSIREFEMLLEKIGFKDIMIIGDYNYNTPISNNTNTISFKATKED